MGSLHARWAVTIGYSGPHCYQEYVRCEYFTCISHLICIVHDALSEMTVTLLPITTE